MNHINAARGGSGWALQARNCWMEPFDSDYWARYTRSDYVQHIITLFTYWFAKQDDFSSREVEGPAL